jgi:Cu/Ag efflux pump CusA
MQEPHWTAFEKVHISLKPAEVLAAQRMPPTTADPSRQVVVPAAGQQELKADAAATNMTESVNDMRAQLKEQSGMIEKLKAELEQLRNEIKTGASKPSSGPQPPRKQTTP